MTDEMREKATVALRDAEHWQSELTALYCKAVGRGIDGARESFILNRWDAAIRSAAVHCGRVDWPWAMRDIERMRADKFNKLNRTDHVSPEKSMHTR